MNCRKCGTYLKPWKEKWDVESFEEYFPFLMKNTKIYSCMACHYIVVGDEHERADSIPV